MSFVVEREELARRCERALSAARLRGARGLILIDGRSGSGKTQLARWLSARLARDIDGLTSLAMDAWYPGWDGLAEGSRILAEEILLAPHAYTAWDWAGDRPGERVSVCSRCPLIVEGCGALTPRTRELADLAVWVDAAAEVRKARALGRDGDAYAPHWDRWAAQEADHMLRDAPRRLADITMDTTSLLA